MQYVVLDLEWNQAMSSKSPIYNRLPIHLRGEIIQIGACKLNDDLTPGEEFQIDVKPVYFRKMHYKVKKLTGIDSERLNDACGFKEAMRQFREFCGDGCTFLTWGYDDKGIMEQNIIVHDLDWDWIAGWVNLQIIYNMQTDGDRNQKSLVTAMEHFGIEQTRVAHDALGDAYNTALVCSHLDLKSGLAGYDETMHQLSLRRKKASEDGEEGPEPLEHLTFTGYATRSEAFADERLAAIPCPECAKEMSTQRWVNQGDKRYMTLAECPDHGKFLTRVKFRHTEDETWTANRIIYKADEEMIEFYKQKSIQNRKRVRRRKKSPSSGENG
ncbi:MAG: exonuclease domain-containing protein [Oscillospiraceae bacterium]|nr:exonuclease domain-containing protein [Oscillospiraceae bacterium]